MTDPDRPRPWLVPGVFIGALAVASLAFMPFRWMQRPTYLRQILLTAFLAPAALTAALLVLGPVRRRLAAALADGPSRLFFAAVWGHALLAWLSLLWTSNLEATLDRSVVLTTLALWASAWLLVSCGERWRRLAAGHLGVGGLIALTGIWFYAGAMLKGSAPARLSYPIGNANTVSVLMIFPVVTAVALLVGSVKNKRIWSWPIAAVAAVGVLSLIAFRLGGSRSGKVGLLAALAVLVGIRLRPRWRLAIAGALVVCLAVGSLWYVSDSDRLARRAEWVKLSGVGSRYYGTLASWGIFKEHPVGGSGAGTFILEAPRHLPPEYYLSTYSPYFLNLAHNEYAEAIAELGLPGLGALLALLGAAFWGAWRGAKGAGGSKDWPDRLLAAGAAAAVAGVAVSALADTSLRFWDFTAFFYAGAALAAGAGRPPPVADATEKSPAPRWLWMLVILGGVVLLIPSLFWGLSDARREHSAFLASAVDRQAAAAGKTSRAAGREAARVEAEAGRADVADDADLAAALRREAGMLRARAEELHNKSVDLYGRAALRYRCAGEGCGYFLYKVLAWHNRVRVLHFAGRYEEAVREAERLAERMPECPQLLRHLAEARRGTGDRAGALAAAVRAGRRDPYYPHLLGFFSDILTKDREENVELIKAAAEELDLGAADRAALASLAASREDDRQQALALVMRLEPTEVTFLPLELWWGQCLLEVERYAESAAAVERHLEAVPHHVEGHRMLARVLAAPFAARGEPLDDETFDKITAALFRCLQLNLEREDVRMDLGKMLMGRGRYARALGVVKPYLPIARRKADFVLLAAEIYRLQGDLDEALSVLKWGWGYARDPRIAKAIKFLESGGG